MGIIRSGNMGLILEERRCESTSLFRSISFKDFPCYDEKHTNDRMHDFGCTRTHTIFLNLPLTLSPRNMVSFKPQPLIHFDRSLPSEFIIFPRLHPDRITRFIDPEPCLIFHTANSWDDYNSQGEVIAINMLGCRFKSAKLVYSAGAVDVPKIERQFGKDDIVQLYYYRFDLTTGAISHAFPLAGIPFEFPTVPPAMGMMPSKYVYGCTMASGSFDERLGGAAKVDCLVKLDVLELIARGKKRGGGKWDEPVDNRSAGEIIVDGKRGEGVISIFNCPDGWYAQEPRFVPRQNGVGEDEGYLLSYGKSSYPSFLSRWRMRKERERADESVR
jgi:carotenoid cleavage dioxygenase-like enzyme